MNPKHIIITTIVVLLMCSGTASAWLSGYDYRMAITVNNGGASTLNYYQFNFTNDTNVLVAAGHMQASGVDCRITDSSDNLIPFWNETTFNTIGTKIWANATILTVGDNTFYMYYGNSSTSNAVAGDETFLRYNVDGVRGFWKQDEASWTGAAGEVEDETTVNDGTITSSATTTTGIYGNAGYFTAANGGVDCGNDTSTNLSSLTYGWVEKATGGDNLILGMCVHNSKLYASTEMNCRLLEWDNSSAWIQKAPQYTTNQKAFAPTSYNGNLYVGTHSIQAGDGGELLMWNGVDNWVLKAPEHNSQDEIRSMAVYNNKIYGGTYPNAKLFEWNGVDAWVEVADQVDSSEHHLIALAEFEGSLYGGVSTTGRLYKWNDVDAWVQVAGAIGEGIYTLAVYNGRLYGGTGATASLVRWDGVSAWEYVAPRYGTTGTTVRGLLVHDEKLYGSIEKSAELLVWNDVDAWTRVCTQYASENTVHCLVEFDGNLYGGSGQSGKLLVVDNTAQVTYFSLETWMYPTEIGRRQYIVDKHIGPTNYFIALWESDNIRFTGMGLSNNDVHSTKVFGSGDLNKWWHIVGVYNGTHKVIYINGTLDNALATTGSITISDSYNLTIGTDLTDVDAFNGRTDETIVWAKGLDAYEVGLLYANYMDKMGTMYNIRKYSSPEPTSSLGTEEDAPSGNNDITLAANTYGFLRKDVTTAQTFSTITAGFAHKVCFSWLDNSGACWESYWSGDAYNAALSIPKNDAYFVLMDGTGETVSCGIRAAGNVAIPTGWYATYLGESTAKTLTQIKTDIQSDGDVTNLYTWDHNAGGTGAWVSVDVTPSHSVLPNQGILINNMGAPYNWDGAVN